MGNLSLLTRKSGIEIPTLLDLASPISNHPALKFWTSPEEA